MVYHQGFALYLPSPVILSLGEESSNNPAKQDFIVQRFHPYRGFTLCSLKAFAFGTSYLKIKDFCEKSNLRVPRLCMHRLTHT